jgi:Helix-turn-helix domain
MPEAVAASTGKHRIVGDERNATNLLRRYERGESIRSLASSSEWSYGFVHRVLSESGVCFRQGGEARRRKNLYGGARRPAASRPVSAP